MKIAMIGHKRIPSREGGVEVVVEELATRMVKKGHMVTCYNRSGKHALDKKQKVQESNEYKGVSLKKVPTIDARGLAAITSSFFATMFVIFSNFDIVHYHAEGPCSWLWLMKWFTKKKIVVTVHGLDWQRAKWGGFATKVIKFGEKQAVKYADEIIVLSKNVQKYFEDEYQRYTHYIPNGVNPVRKVKANIIEKKYNLTQDNYILFLGRIVPEKGIHYLLDAYNSIKTNKKLVISGGASDTNEYFNSLKNKAQKNKNIIFTGFVQGSELAELYSNAYIYCLPSDVEGMPLSLLEAMSYGNCCLTSNIDECSQVVGNNGITFSKSNADDLKRKLRTLLEDEKIVNKYKSCAKNYVTNKYNWENIVNSTIEIYEKCK